MQRNDGRPDCQWWAMMAVLFWASVGAWAGIQQYVAVLHSVQAEITQLSRPHPLLHCALACNHRESCLGFQWYLNQSRVCELLSNVSGIASPVDGMKTFIRTYGHDFRLLHFPNLQKATDVFDACEKVGGTVPPYTTNVNLTNWYLAFGSSILIGINKTQFTYRDLEGNLITVEGWKKNNPSNENFECVLLQKAGYNDVSCNETRSGLQGLCVLPINN